MVAGGRKRKRKKKEMKRRPYRRRWVRVDLHETKSRKKIKRKKPIYLTFLKLEYYKEILDFHNIDYHISFLITQISGQ